MTNIFKSFGRSVKTCLTVNTKCSFHAYTIYPQSSCIFNYKMIHVCVVILVIQNYFTVNQMKNK